MNVLIVEDDRDIGDELALLLRDQGHDVVTAVDGAAALAWLAHATTLPSVILLDLIMPVMDGWEFRARQRRDPRLHGVPVIVMSGAGQVKAEASALGADGILLKPFDVAALDEALAPFTGHR